MPEREPGDSWNTMSMKNQDQLPTAKAGSTNSLVSQRFPALVAAAVALLSLAAEGYVAPAALLTTLVDALAALTILGPAILFGHLLLRFCHLPSLTRRWIFLYSTALGIGFLSLLVLGLGMLGMFQRALWVFILVIMSLAGFSSLIPKSVSSPTANTGSNVSNSKFWSLFSLAAIPFLTLGLLAASNPPGMIWQEEGYGYDVLEYHLALPKEYLEHGAITYLPHNVYSSFPANLEMLYLLGMIIQDDDPREMGTTANFIHLSLAVLLVGAAWALGRDVSPEAGVVTGLVAASYTWLEYLGGLAYVENGMLFWGICSLATVLHANRCARPSIQWSSLGGLLAGLSIGCKYTAMPFIAFPIAMTWLFSNTSWFRRLVSVTAFVLFALIASAPWFTKNWALTGNPVFPLANQWFKATPPGWGPEQDTQWHRAHSAHHGTGWLDGMKSVWTRIPADSEQRFGPALLLLGLAGLIARHRDRLDYAMLSILLVQLAVWVFATHHYTRFAVPIMLPLTVLACRSLPIHFSRMRYVITAAFLIAGLSWNFYFAARRHLRESIPGAPASIFYDGLVPGYEYMRHLNHELTSKAHVLLLGEARSFFIHPKVDYFVAFNGNPFFDMITRGTPPAEMAQWLQSKRYTHMVVNWSEIRRISQSYGFTPNISEEELASAIDGLANMGLKLGQSFDHPALSNDRYVEVYELMPAE